MQDQKDQVQERYAKMEVKQKIYSFLKVGTRLEISLVKR